MQQQQAMVMSSQQLNGTPHKVVMSHSPYQQQSFYSPIRQGNPGVSRVLNVPPKVIVHGSYTPDRQTIFTQQSALTSQRTVSPIVKPTIMNSSYLRNQHLPSHDEKTEKDNNNINQQFSTLLEENQKLIKIIEQKNAELSKAKENVQPQGDNKELQNQIDELTQQLTEERDQFQNFKTKIIMVIEENEKLQQVYEQLQTDYQNLEKNFKSNGTYGNSQHVEDLEQQIKTIRAENLSYKQQQSQPSEALLEQIQSLQLENERLIQGTKNDARYQAIRQKMEHVLANF